MLPNSQFDLTNVVCFCLVVIQSSPASSSSSSSPSSAVASRRKLALRALDLMWHVIQDETKASPELAAAGRLRLERMLLLSSASSQLSSLSTTSHALNTCDDFTCEARFMFLQKSSKNLSLRKSVPNSLLLLQSIAEALPLQSDPFQGDSSGHDMDMDLGSSQPEATMYVDGDNNVPPPPPPPEFDSSGDGPKSRPDALMWLNEHCHLLHALLADIQAFLFRAKTLFDKDNMTDNDGQDNPIMDNGLGFLEHVRLRLRFLRFLMRNSPLQLTTERVDVLWDVLCTKSVTVRQRELSLFWFEQALSPSPSGFVEVDHAIIRYIFEHKLTSPSSFANVTFAAYSCIERYFVHLNMEAGKLIDVENPQGVIFCAREHQLDGGDVMWRLVLEATDTGESKMRLQVVVMGIGMGDRH